MKESTENPLGKQVQYGHRYEPGLLYPISRFDSRQDFLNDERSALPFVGYDFWNAYEVSWLNLKGLPQVAVAQFRFEIDRSFIIESKSFKLYLNSLNQEKFPSLEVVREVIVQDLSNCCGSLVAVKLVPLATYKPTKFTSPNGFFLDDLDIEIQQYQTNPDLLAVNAEAGIVNEIVYSHLLRSNCPITGQPDWGTVQVSYEGAQMDHAGLLQYIVSYRIHSGYHEQVTEQIFTDLIAKCAPGKLEVQTWFVRRGGLDINCLRSTEKSAMKVRGLFPRTNRQ
ncbi:MAG: NADPH-dependent 7-cyano-7-deazaguanine reductase QueF [Proteobacteria bacterium]|nr:NADPH-dependent 7-cyano-7-deazaguanine reductase QueF [Pseudomonadota bacterium]